MRDYPIYLTWQDRPIETLDRKELISALEWLTVQVELMRADRRQTTIPFYRMSQPQP